jgi:hypothetical protein
MSTSVPLQAIVTGSQPADGEENVTCRLLPIDAQAANVPGSAAAGRSKNVQDRVADGGPQSAGTVS